MIANDAIRRTEKVYDWTWTGILLSLLRITTSLFMRLFPIRMRRLLRKALKRRARVNLKINNSATIPRPLTSPFSFTTYIYFVRFAGEQKKIARLSQRSPTFPRALKGNRICIKINADYINPNYYRCNANFRFEHLLINAVSINFWDGPIPIAKRIRN